MALAFERQRSSMVVPSRTLERSKAQNYLKKAGELYLDMLEARRSGRFKSAVISAVHCGVSSSDAYTVYVVAIIAASKDNRDALRLISDMETEAAMIFDIFEF